MLARVAQTRYIGGNINLISRGTAGEALHS